jgi:peptidase E
VVLVLSPESDEKLDHFILSHSKKTKNNIGFLGTASKDDEEKINKFYKRFENTNSELSHFNLTSKCKWFLRMVIK